MGGKSDSKAAYFDKLKGLLEEYKSIFIVTVDNVSSQQMHKIRKSLRGEGEVSGVVLMGKNTMVRRAIKSFISDFPEYERLLPHVKGNVGFIFSNADLAKTRDVILAEKVAAPARAGAVAPADVYVPAGNTGMEPGKTSFFQALGVPTKIARGTIEITADLKLVEAGSKVGASEATLLNMLNISPFTYGMSVAQVYSEGQTFSPNVLDVEESQLLAALSSAIKTIATISLAANYPTLPSVMHSVVNGYKNLISVAVETDYSWAAIDELKDRIANPEAYAAAAPQAAEATQEKPTEEEKPPEEDEESSDDADEDTVKWQDALAPLPFKIKERRIKCDEQHPICGNCVRQNRQCDFATNNNAPSTAISQVSDAGGSGSLARHSSPANGPETGRLQPTAASFDFLVPSVDAVSELPELALLDLRLMHQYTSKTCFTVSATEGLDDIWQNFVPELALQFDFLMHGLLALSAIHLAVGPSKQKSYEEYAIRHQNAALISFRPVVDRITPTNCEAFFIFSVLAVRFAFGIRQVSTIDWENDSIDGILEIYALLRGVAVIVAPAITWIEQGRLAPVLRHRFRYTASFEHEKMAEDIERALNRLDEYNGAQADPEDEPVKISRSSTIKSLRVCFRQLSMYSNDQGCILFWITSIESSYIELLKSRDPMALAIFAYFGVALHDAGDSWWSNGWGKRVVEIISCILDDQWHDLIWCAKQHVGASYSTGLKS
ncbi:MAG: hypothetical protein Q9167_006521 [Letrouitia subvulpina]